MVEVNCMYGYVPQINWDDPATYWGVPPTPNEIWLRANWKRDSDDHRGSKSLVRKLLKSLV
ncbi:MAG: hypothetical protein WC796_03340 [Candidatus Pacearchaeota archaeon]|jgi:hypothetical protein